MKKGMLVGAGWIVFFLAMVYLVFFASYLQLALGTVGAGIGEVGLLMIAILFCFATKQSFKEMFPIKKPAPKLLWGAFLIYLGAYICATIVGYTTDLLFPHAAATNNAIIRFFSSSNYTVGIISMAILPAVCEEALHRGAILFSFGAIRNTTIRVLLMGLLFGLFHVDLFRFLPTAFLGMALTYIMLKTQNMFYPVLMHFLNNFLVLTLYARANAATDSSAILVFPGYWAYICIICFYFAPVVLCFYFGYYLLNGMKDHKRLRRNNFIVVIISLCLFLIGLLSNLDLSPVIS